MGKSAVVCGAGGFIANHLVKRLKAEGYWVRGIDIKGPEFLQVRPMSSRYLICANRKTAPMLLLSKTAAQTRSTSSRPIWAVWDLFTVQNAMSCATMH